jgi:heterodisulfide reductase subunit B
MIEIGYYPGCTLKSTARNFETSALALLELLGVKAIELKDWYCCGVHFSQVEDNLMLQLAPLRTLMKASDEGYQRILTLCSMCYHTLRRAALFLQADPERQRIVNDIMDRNEMTYQGKEVEVIELLTLLRMIGTDQIATHCRRKTADLKVAPYYGCLPLRPKEIAIDNPNDPQIMEQLISSIGCTPVFYPMRIECCGSYQIVNNPLIVEQRTRQIVAAAHQAGAELLVVICPLCHYNLDALQVKIQQQETHFQPLPVLYLSQLLALMAGIPDGNDWALHYIDPRPLLIAKGLL